MTFRATPVVADGFAREAVDNVDLCIIGGSCSFCTCGAAVEARDLSLETFYSNFRFLKKNYDIYGSASLQERPRYDKKLDIYYAITPKICDMDMVYGMIYVTADVFVI